LTSAEIDDAEYTITSPKMVRNTAAPKSR